MSRYIFFGGKGGVGKTTSAAAYAFILSKKYKTLVVSTDPAHSLSDAFDMPVGNKETYISENLWGIEITPESLKGDVKQLTGTKSHDTGAGALMGMDIAMDLMDSGLEFPGIDEITALGQFMKYSKEGRYDKIVFDTAPTGHTMRLLSLPDVLDSYIGKMIKIRMQMEGVVSMFKQFFGADREDNSLEILEKMKQDVAEVRDVLTSSDTEFVLVTISEQMAVSESLRYLDMLKKWNIAVNKIIVNKITPENDCEFCSQRRLYQLRNLGRIGEMFGDKSIISVPLLSNEVYGMDGLGFIGRYIEKLCGEK